MYSRSLVGFLGLLASWLSPDSVSDASRERSDSITISGLIVGGTNTTIEEIPYAAAMLVKERFMCGGSVLSPRHIVTAAHCCDGIKAEDVSFRVGSSYSMKGGVTVPARKITIHPLYNDFFIDFDVAVVELEKPLEFGKTIRPVAVATTEPADGTLVRASGWGYLSENGSLSHDLQSVLFPVVNRRVCRGHYVNVTLITPSMLCAGAEGKDSCRGDSGGPLVDADGFLAGVVSFGKGCGQKNSPGVYANMAHLAIRLFIRDQLGSA